MSYQPFPATGAPPAAPARGRRNPALLIIGIIVLLVGVVGGLALLFAAGKSTEDSVKDLGRAAPGCKTTLQFKQTGTFLVFFERKGSVADLGCSTSGSFNRDDGTVPEQTLTLTDADEQPVDIDDGSGVSYDTGGFTGEQIGKVQIDATGDYTFTVTPDDSSDTAYAIAIGKDPTANESTLQIAGIAVLAVGVIVGALLIVLGLRRRPTPAAVVPTAAAPSWGQVSVGPTVSWPPAPPSAPPYGGPPTSFGIPGGGSGPPPSATPVPPPTDPFSRPPGS